MTDPRQPDEPGEPKQPVPSLEDLLEAALRTSGDARFDLVDEIRAHGDLDALTAEAAGAAAYLLAGSGDPADLAAVARLSATAHEAGIDGAGRIHAEASDKIALYSGRPQPYGTVMLEQHGEIMQPPVDHRVSDDDRMALGVPPLAELHDRMQTLTRELAIERAATPGVLPDRQRWCRVWTEPDPGALRQRMATDGAAWADGDVLTIVAEMAEPFVALPVFEMASWPVGDDLQVLQVRVDRLDEAVITYRFVPVSDPMPMAGRGHDGRFRGSAAPDELRSTDPLAGSTFDHGVESVALGEPRRVSVYRPPGHQAGDATPVIYATDGNMIAPYLRRLDAAILDGWCPPVVVVAAHAAPFDPVQGNRRAAEYLPGFDRASFDNHHRFFVDELVAWAEDTLGVPSDAARRGVFGCSDGGGHALAVAQLRPNQFGHVFAFSTGMAPDLGVSWGSEHPFVHLCAGTLEGAFHQATEAWGGHLLLCDVPHHFTERVAGHDLVQWAEELPRALARAWG